MLAPFAAAAIGSWAMRFQGLWNPRITAMRWIELSKLTRAAGILGVGVLLVDRVAKLHISVEHAVVACAATWALLVVWRSAFRSWVAHNRRNNRFTRRVIIVGTDRRAVELARLFDIHPEAGMRVTGLIGSRREADSGRARPPVARRLRRCRRRAGRDAGRRSSWSAPLTSVPTLLHTLMRDEPGRGRELLFHPGLSGIDARRVKASPVANEALLYVESGTLSRFDLALKRAFDIVVSATLLMLASPILAVVASSSSATTAGPCSSASSAWVGTTASSRC